MHRQSVLVCVSNVIPWRPCAARVMVPEGGGGCTLVLLVKNDPVCMTNIVVCVLCRIFSPHQGKSLAATGAALSKKLTTPSSAERVQLARLFPSSRARSGSTFDPTAECVAMSAHKKKKSSGISGRTTNREVVLMKCFRPVIPIKKYRCDLKVDQRVKILQFRRGMSPTQVKNVIQRGFSHLGCSSFLYLETFSNSLRVCNKQQLDGSAVIDRRGALYLCEV